MTPSQRLALALRQTGDAATAVLDWTEHEGGRLGPAGALLRQSLDQAGADIEHLHSALERPPAVGLLPLSGLGQATLVSRLLGRSRNNQHEVERRAIIEVCEALLASDQHGYPACTVRLAARQRQRPPEGYAFAVRLLGLSDLIVLMTQNLFPDHAKVL